MKILNLIPLPLIFIIIWQVECGTVTDTETLVTHLFTNYSREIRPPYDHDDRLFVGVTFFLFSIFEFDEIDGVISLVASPFLIWQDYRLTWTPSDFNGLIEITVPKSKLWVPDVFIVNPAKKMEPIGTDDFIGRVADTGHVSWLPGGIIKSTCDVDMTNFPFDTQTCEVVMAAWCYLPNEVTLIPTSEEIDFTYYQPNQMWTITKSKLERHALGSYNGIIRAVFTMKRKPLYYGLNILSPIFLLCILNPLVFILPVESGERVSYAVTIFLSFAVFMSLISDSMPKVSEPMSRLSFLIFTSMAYSTIICIVTILTMRLYYKDGDSQVPSWLKSIYKLFNACSCGRLLCRCCRERKPKVEDSDIHKTKQSDNFVRKVEVLDYKEDPRTADRYPKTDDIDWKRIALFIDHILFIGSIIFVLIFIILTISLLAGS